MVPHAIYATQGMDALYDYTEGIMDLVLGDEEIVDYYGRPEMIFFGPDEGTAPLMDAVADSLQGTRLPLLAHHHHRQEHRHSP